MKSAEWVANEAYKCAVCGKVLSCKGTRFNFIDDDLFIIYLETCIEQCSNLLLCR